MATCAGPPAHRREEPHHTFRAKLSDRPFERGAASGSANRQPASVRPHPVSLSSAVDLYRIRPDRALRVLRHRFGESHHRRDGRPRCWGRRDAAGCARTGRCVHRTGGWRGSRTTTDRYQRVAARLFDEVFSQRKPDVCVLLMTANAVNHTPAGDFDGPAGFEQYVAGIWNAYPDATFAIDDGVTDGDLVTLHWTIGGAQAEATGHLDGLAILRFEQDM
ncbi:MAG: ester cyclase, partial [Chloroflexota bacterium]|nr:ester cyclase [Chloroflexota bacterium]